MQEGINQKAYLDKKDIMLLTGCPQTRAYEVIQAMNRELDEQGYITFKGRVPRLYAEKRMGYTGGDEDGKVLAK